MKKIFGLLASIAMILSIVITPVSAETKVIKVSTADELIAALTETTVTPVQPYITIDITDDIDMSEATLTMVSGYLNGYYGAKDYVVNGNGKTITNLTAPLFSSTWAGSATLTISDLTIADSKIVGGKADATGCGAFVGNVDSTPAITLNNCHLLNSSVKGADWTGGLIGYVSGYSKQNDGPVFTTINVNECSVLNSEITGDGSTGGIVGHASGSTWTKFIIEDSKVIDNTITCLDSSKIKAGSVIGTVGAAGEPEAGKVGGVELNAYVCGNNVVSNGVKTNRVYGRIGSKGGKLTVTGGVYCDLESEEDFDAPEGEPASSYTINVNSDEISYGHEVVNVEYPTCTEGGYTGDEYCSAREEVVVEGNKVDATGHNFVNLKCSCGAEIIVDADTHEDAITEEEAEKVEVKEVTIVDDHKTDGAVATVKKEATDMVITLVSESEAAEELVEAGVITEETAAAIIEAVEAGEAVEAIITVTEITSVSKETEANIETVAEKTLGKEDVKVEYLDVKIELFVDGDSIGEFHKLSKPITVTVALPEELVVEGAKYVVIRDHEGTVTALTTVDNGDGTISFTTDQFSTYAIAYTTSKAPETGDTTNVFGLLAMLLGSAFIISRKRTC